jgi:hypothetical protein
MSMHHAHPFVLAFADAPGTLTFDGTHGAYIPPGPQPVIVLRLPGSPVDRAMRTWMKATRLTLASRRGADIPEGRQVCGCGAWAEKPGSKGCCLACRADAERG